jgi:hypothetical protein
MSSRKTNPKKKSSVVDSNGLDQAKSLLGQVTAIVGPAPALTATDRKRSAKLRKGGETVIATVATLSDQFGLTVASHPTTTMVQKASQAKALIPLHKQLVTATKQVADQMFSANSESWAAATVHYTMLRRLAKTDGDLATALAPVKQFFAHQSATVIKTEDAKTGHHRGAKPTKVVKAKPVVETTSDAPAPEAAPTPAPTATAPSPTATPATPAPTNGAHS